MRRISALYGTYSFELGVDLRESITICDLGDIFTIPGNIEKTFDQISKAVAHVYASGALPVVLGGDHSIGYPTVRGVAQHLEGNLGIIHFDRHVDTQETDLDERMHTTPWFHATDIPNVPAKNLVQIGIGGWQAPRPGVKIGRERGTTIMTVTDCVEMGIEAAAQRALEVAWKGADAGKMFQSVRFLPPVIDGQLAHVKKPHTVRCHTIGSHMDCAISQSFLLEVSV